MASNPLKGYKKLLRLTNQDISPGVGPDDRSGACYLPDDTLILATEIAFVTGRPLLIYGVPGSGKSSWAPYIARNLGWAYHEVNITADMDARDLYYRFDAVKRLRDAQRKDDDLDESKYLTPRQFWFAFNFQSAVNQLRNVSSDEKIKKLNVYHSNNDRDVTRSVVLIDEIDKADPNLPNSLLDVIACRRFPVEPLEVEIEAVPPEDDETCRLPDGSIKKHKAAVKKINQHSNMLMVITTNDERDLPPAFLRRCVVHRIEAPTADRLKQIAYLRRDQDWKNLDDEEKLQIDKALTVFAEAAVRAREDAEKEQKPGPSVSEFLDLVTAWERAKFDYNKECLETVLKTVFQK